MGERWFHGGTPDLRPGGWLLPPAESGYRKGRAVVTEKYLGIDGAAFLGPEIDRDDRVYLTTNRQFARAYAMAAVFNPRGPVLAYGALYTAEPEDPEPDPDLPDREDLGRFCQAPRARIRAVYDPVIIPDPDWCMRILAQAIAPGTWAEVAQLQREARR